MRSFVISLFFISWSLQLCGQGQANEYSRVKIDLTTVSIKEVASLGLEADHGHYAKGKHLVNDFSQREIQLLRNNNIPFEIIIDDVKAHYRNQNHQSHDHKHVHSHDHDVVLQRGAANCDENEIAYNYKTPENYAYGSMGGYLTYEEMLSTLDEMTALYPNLISARQPIGEIVTHEDRSIYFLRLSDNPNEEEADEPQVLYTALHHAREPNSLSQMIFYLWYLLENYETDAEVKYLVDNTAMYFVPCINPDGYIYNQTIEPGGGGLWRKNRYQADNTTFGVDLNRNYGFEWGFDDVGSSINPNNETYRGTEAFSEPETQAIRDLCNAHQFQITLNYHTFGNLLIYPWGYSDSLTDDHPSFSAFSDAMTRENNYFAGTGTETVGYTVNGDSDDWMYGETASKPAIFAMTPEVGDNAFGFWPPQDQIDRLNKSSLLQNLVAAHLLLNYGEAQEQNGQDVLTAKTGTLDINLKKYGLKTGELSLAVSAASQNVSVDENITSWTMEHLEDQAATFSYVVSDDAVTDDEILFVVSVDNGIFVKTDTLRKSYLDGTIESLYTEDASSVDNWTITDEWGIVDTDFVSSPTSFTDSPDGYYDGGVSSSMTMIDAVDLANAEAAFLNFYAKWDIESGYDFAQVMISTDGNDYTPLCGKYTKLGTNNQDDGEPIYDGDQSDWVLEEINLSDYLGQTIWIRFRIVADTYIEGDGFYFDDLTINVALAGSTSTNDEGSLLVNEFSIAPNPYDDVLKVAVHLLDHSQEVKLELVNGIGKVLVSDHYQNVSAGRHQFLVKNSNLKEGVYFLQLYVDGIKIKTQKVIKL